MSKRIGKREKILLGWAAICLLVLIIGIAVPVKRTVSQGLEGANQANIQSVTGELTEGHTLEFVLNPPTQTASQIGFFFTPGEYEFTEGVLSLQAVDLEQNRTVGEAEYKLEDLTGDGFLFVPLDWSPEQMKVLIRCDAKKEGPAIWLNETTRTPGDASFDGQALEKSLVYNLIYTVDVHEYQKPVLVALILFLFGLGIYGAGGIQRTQKHEKTKAAKKAVRITPRQAGALVCCVAVVALVFFYLYDTRIRIAQNTTERVTLLESNGEILPVSEENSMVEQMLEPKEDMLTGFGVRFLLDGVSALEQGSMHAKVEDLTLGQVMCETDIQASQFISGEYVGLLFDNSQTGVADHRYRITLEFSPELWDSGLSLIRSDEGICVNAYLYFQIFLKRFFFFMFLAIEVFVCLFWYLGFVRKVRIETLFLVSILFCGLIYNVMLTPQMVPDEAKHIDMAYRYSNELLGYPSLGDTKCLMRADDAAMEFTSSPSLKNYYNIYHGLFSRVSSKNMVEAEVNSNIEGSILFYWPAVLGMSFARILGLGTVPMLLLARYLNLLVFALLAWMGMKRLPFGKTTLFVLAMLPINLQQCTSFSHDAMAHGIIFFYSCLMLEAIFGGRKMNGQKLALMELAVLFLLYCKGGSYAPLALLPLLIPVANYESKRAKVISTSALLGIPALAFIMNHMQTVSGMVSTTAATSVVSVGDGSAYLTGYTIGYFLNDPLEFVYMMVNTVFDKAGFYLESLVGYKLGWVEIETSEVVVILFLFLLFLSNCECREEAGVRISAFSRFWMIFLCMGCAGLILIGMLLEWTPMGYVSVEGVQGRYFLPFMMILLTALKNRNLILNRRIDSAIVTATLGGQLLTLVYIIKQITIV